ncbi:retrovirus-related pol polyprotein from transposon TNT 1-94, partial [Tanacetum coccineum]
CKTAIEMWNDLILAHERPFDTRDTKIVALRLKFNAFKSLKGEKVMGTFTRLAEMLDSDSDVEEDQRTSNEFMADLNVEYHERALLANQKRFYKRSGRVRSARKPIDKTKETCFACGKTGHFQKECPSNKTSTPSYPSSNNSFNKFKSYIAPINQTSPHNTEDEGTTRIRAFMAITEDEPSMGKADARSGQWVDITMKKEPLPPLPKLTEADLSGASKSLISLSDLTANMVDLTLNTAFKEIKKSSNKVSQTYVIKKKTESKHPAVQNSCPDKNALPSTEQLILTLMKEVKGIKKQIMIPLDTSSSVSQACSSKTPKQKVYLKRSIWYLDSGCFRHMTGVKQYLHKYSKEPCHKVGFGDDSIGDTKGYGLVIVVESLSLGLLILKEPFSTKMMKLFSLLLEEEMSMSLICHLLTKIAMLVSLSMLHLVKIENLNEVRVKELRSDNGTEFRNHKLEEFYDEKEGDAINFDENRSFPYDEFIEPRSKDTQCSVNIEYFPYVSAYENITSAVLPTIQNSVTFEEPPKVTIADDLPAIHELDHVESVFFDDQSALVISPSAEVILQNPVPQDKWSREKHIELVNIIGEPLAGITTRSRVRDSDAASAHECLYVNFLSKIEPKKLIDALKEKGWVISMQEELNQFERNKVWTLVPKPHGKTIIGIKWIWKNKMDEKGVVTKNKARLVTQGYNQQERIDYEETFAPVARLEANRIFLAYAAYMGFVVYQMDVKSAFLNGKISKEVYVQQPPVFESREFPDHVCKLDKALYRLNKLPSLDLLKKYDLADCASVKCPMLHPNNLGPDESGVSVNKTLFRGMIGYQANPKESHLVTVKRISRYLKGTPNLGLWYPKGSGFDLKAYSNSDCAGCNLDRESTSGGCQILGGKLVYWSAKKQSSVAISSAEAKYYFIRDHILKGEIELHFVPTDLQLADIFTKPLAQSSFTRLVAELGMLNIEKQVSDKKQVSETTVQLVTQPKAPTDRMTKKRRISPSSKPKSPYKFRVILPKRQVAETQHAEVTMATADATKSLAFESAEEQGNQPSTAEAEKVIDQTGEEEKDVEFVSMEEVIEEQSKEIPTVEQLMDEVDKQNKAIQETPESPYDTESEIKIVKSYFTSHIPKVQDQILHDSNESADVQEDYDYEAMSEDDHRSVSRFETADSDNTQGNDVSHSDHIFQDNNASVEPVSERLTKKQTKLNKKVVKHLNRQFNIFHVAQSDRFSRLETELSKTLKSDMGKSVTYLVESGMKEVKDDLKSQAKSLGKFCMDAKDANPAATQGDHQSAEPLVESQEEQPAHVKVANKESAPSASDNKLSKGKELIVHNLEKKKSEGIISVEDDLDNDDKQPLSKRFKIMTLIHDIPNPTHLNTFVPEQLLKSKEQQKSIQEFTDYYVVNSRKEATMKITKGDKPLNLIIHPNFRLKMQRLGLPQPPELATFGLTAKEKKRKRTEFIKEVFQAGDVGVDGMGRNLIPPPGVLPIQGLVINEPESGIFFMNENTDIGFQRESEFHLTPTTKLI